MRRYTAALEALPGGCRGETGALLAARAEAGIKAGRWGPALKDCEAALRLCPSSSRALRLQAQALVGLRR